MTFIEQLADWVLGFDFERLSETAIRHAKLLLLDAIGCGLAALEDEEFRAAVTVAEQLGGVPECTILGSAVQTSAPNAVLANGALIRALDLNDIYWGRNRGGHPSDNMATVLAAAERGDASGRDAITAIVIGYEIDGRLRDINAAETDFDYTTYSGLVSATAAGRLLGLDHDRLTNAMALGATFGPSLAVIRGGTISAAKWLGTGLASHMGVLAALLAAEGLSGPRGVFEDPHGWAEVILPGADTAKLLEPAVSDFRIEHASIKAYPSVMTSQAPVAAALQARSRLSGLARDAERIDLRIADIPMVRSHVENPQRRHPSTRETADHSIHFLVAVALLDGELTPRQFEHERWLDPEVLAMMDRIRVEVDPSLSSSSDTFPCGITVTLRSGESASADVPYHPGHYHDGGMNAATVGAKFDSYAGARLGEATRTQVKDFILSLDAASSIRPLMALLRPA
jgi:2-methylcitrate dehydratase